MLQESTGMNKLEWLSNLFEEVNLFPNPSTWSLCHSYETIPYPSHCLLNEETHLKKGSHLEWKFPLLKILCIYLYRYWKGKCKAGLLDHPVQQDHEPKRTGIMIVGSYYVVSRHCAGEWTASNIYSMFSITLVGNCIKSRRAFDQLNYLVSHYIHEVV